MNYTWKKIGATYNIIVTATCADAMSGMQKVEFYFNGELQKYYPLKQDQITSGSMNTPAART